MTGNQPVKKYKAGAVQVAIWENEVVNRDGGKGVVYSATIERRYKDDKGNWRGTASLHANDLPKAILALGKAFEFVTLGEDAQTNEGELI